MDRTQSDGDWCMFDDGERDYAYVPQQGAMSSEQSTGVEPVGPIGPGTPHARMVWFWERMRKHEDLLHELVGYSPVMSNYPPEVAVADAFDKLAEERRSSQHEHPEQSTYTAEEVRRLMVVAANEAQRRPDIKWGSADAAEVMDRQAHASENCSGTAFAPPTYSGPEPYCERLP